MLYMKLGIIGLLLALSLAACGSKALPETGDTAPTSPLSPPAGADTVPGSEGATTGAPQGGTQPAAVQAAINKLSEISKAAASEIKVISSAEMDWPNTCLGLAKPAEMCDQVITPGWQIVLEVGGAQYEFHTDANGQNVRYKEL